MSVAQYVAAVPREARHQFDQLRTIVKESIPGAKEVLSYGILGYRIDEKRPLVFISGLSGRVALYPIPSQPDHQSKLQPYVRGRGTLRFALDAPLPAELIQETVTALIAD